MDETEWLAERFEQHRPRLRAVAYRMLGWLTTVVARECLHVLRSRRRREVSFEGHLPDPVITPDGDLDPEQEALLANSVGLALLVVLDHLTPAERLAFVLHDMFELPFKQIAPMVGRTPAATRQLASRDPRRAGRGQAGPRPTRCPTAPRSGQRRGRSGDYPQRAAVLRLGLHRCQRQDRRDQRYPRPRPRAPPRGGR